MEYSWSPLGLDSGALPFRMRKAPVVELRRIIPMSSSESWASRAFVRGSSGANWS